MTEAEVVRRNIERYEQALQAGHFDDSGQRKIRKMLKELEGKLVTLTAEVPKPFR